MPIYEYTCKEHGVFEIFSRNYRTGPAGCPTCGAPAPVAIQPVRTKVERTWNDKANEYQRTPYDQAKAQAWNTYHEKIERGLEAQKPNETMIQEAARAIDKDKKTKRPKTRRPKKSYNRV